MIVTLRWLSLAVGTLLVAILASGPRAQAQNLRPLFARTWVSGVGDDANPCDRTAPCQTFAAAQSLTVAGGEIDVLDSAGYGDVIITKALTIDGTENQASILGGTFGSTAITVNAGPNDDVVVRGLSFNGTRTGLYAIRFNSGRDLHVEHVAIENFRTAIDFEPTGNSDLVVRDSDIRDNIDYGILSTSSGGNARVTIDNTRIAAGLIGVGARSNSRVSISNSLFTGSYNGLQAQPDTGAAEINVVNSVVALSGNVGILASGQATVRLSRVTIEGNGTGIQESGGGTVYSYLDNQNTNNYVNGAPNAPATPSPTATSVPTPTATPVPTMCRPRPNVGVKVWQVRHGRLAVSITANEGTGTPSNALTALRFTSTDNGNVDIENIVGGWGNFTVPVANGTMQETFFVNRIDGLFATTINLIVQDRCGDWPTSVGGGPSAF
jgi:hypothetical protein